MFYEQVKEISQHTGVTPKKAVFIANQGGVVDKNNWIEQFMCKQHGNMWMVVHKEDDILTARFAQDTDWKCTSGTINPNNPNPSVGEFSYRMSRQTSAQLKNLYNH